MRQSDINLVQRNDEKTDVDEDNSKDQYEDHEQ